MTVSRLLGATMIAGALATGGAAAGIAGAAAAPSASTNTASTNTSSTPTTSTSPPQAPSRAQSQGSGPGKPGQQGKDPCPNMGGNHGSESKSGSSTGAGYAMPPAGATSQ